MNASEENTISMLRAVASLNETAPEPIKDSMFGYNDLMDQLVDKTDKIGTLNGEQDASIVRYQLEKTTGKDALVKEVMPIVFLIKAYAMDVENQVLETAMNAHTHSKLIKMRDSKTDDVAQEILATATQNLTQLIPYGVTQNVIDNANDSLTDYREELSKPRNNIVNKKEKNERIDQLFIESKRILFKLDTRVNAIKTTQPQFYKDYFNNRMIVDYKGSKLALRGKVLDINGNPINNVIVSIPSLGIETKTTAKGNYEFKSLPAGILNLKFNKVTFDEVSQNVGIVKGERLQLDILLKNTQSNVASA